MGGFSLWHWLIVLVIVVLVFGTRRLSSGAKDLGSAVREFKKGMRGDDEPAPRLRDEREREDLDARPRDTHDVDRDRR